MAAKLLKLNDTYYISTERVISVKFYPTPLMYYMTPVYAKVVYANDFGSIECMCILSKVLANKIEQQLNEQ